MDDDEIIPRGYVHGLVAARCVGGVNDGRIVDGGGKHPERVEHQQHVQGPDHAGQRHPEQGVGQAQFSDRDELGHDGDLTGQHQGGQEQQQPQSGPASAAKTA